jgi:mannitol/fructose-specific phosphotransferase system IIA component (Ntr-type)
MISLEMTKDEADTVQNVIERFLDHLQVEIIHTDKREFRAALKEREKFGFFLI